MGGLEKCQKQGRAKQVLSRFCRHEKKKVDDLRKVAPLSLIGFGRFSLLIPPCLFTVHVRPVLSPCQAGNTCCIFTCVSNSYTMNNVINTICTRNVYNIICSTARSQAFWPLYNNVDTFVMLETSLVTYFKYILEHFIEYIINLAIL